MPVVTRRDGEQSSAENSGELNCSPLIQVLLDVASAILTARSCDQPHKQSSRSCDPLSRSVPDCEQFVAITKEVMRQHIQALSSQRIPLCLEVKGQADSTSLLLEQWCLQTSSHSVRGPDTTLSFLTQAVTSFLHFSQLRSWTVANGGRLPFELLCRVCAPGEDVEQFPSPPDIHTFPTAPLTSHTSLEVTVKTLPRHTSLPPSLAPHIPTLTHPLSHCVEKKPISHQIGSDKDCGASSQLTSSNKHIESGRSNELTAVLTSDKAAVPLSRKEPPCDRPVAPAGSPVPWNRGASNKRRSCALNIKCPVRPRPPMRSNSCPAIVPSLCLLGTFEESVLNGRLKPCGKVTGFTAELGASGSFRPAHTTLPVEAAYFSVHSQHQGVVSPYLGHIDLADLGRKGYRVPKKGTFQLTLFNPNKTVVKIFIVTYDLSDMPTQTQTFIRQKTLSKQTTPNNMLPALHYLIHLRFHSSKTGHIYLTRNIKLIFASRAPDTMDSGVKIYTKSEAPTHPKYCPL